MHPLVDIIPTDSLPYIMGGVMKYRKKLSMGQSKRIVRKTGGTNPQNRPRVRVFRGGERA